MVEMQQFLLCLKREKNHKCVVSIVCGWSMVQKMSTTPCKRSSKKEYTVPFASILNKYMALLS